MTSALLIFITTQKYDKDRQFCCHDGHSILTRKSVFTIIDIIDSGVLGSCEKVSKILAYAIEYVEPAVDNW